MRIPFVGPTYPLESKPASVQQTVNMYPVPIETQNERVTWVFKDMPGLVEATVFEAPAATVIVLFHMTETAGLEGIAEFTGGNDATDQTGATWSASNAHWGIDTNDPKFGQGSLRGDGGNEIGFWERDSAQSSAPASFTLTQDSVFAIEAWFFKASGGISTSTVFFDIAHFSYDTGFYTFSISLRDDDTVRCIYDGSSLFVNIQSAPIPANTWTHVRANYDGTTVRLFINGELAASEAASGISEDIGSINYSSIVLTDSFNPTVRIDEAYAVMGTTLGIDNFTPPVAPWPNPA